MSEEFYTSHLEKGNLDSENFFYTSPSAAWFWYQRKRVILKWFNKMEKVKELNILDLGTGKGKTLFEIQKKSD